MRVLVCGGRDYRNAEKVFDTLDKIHAKTPVSILIEGGALGADQSAAIWADARGVKRQRFVADWAAFGKSAGPRRNQQMIDQGRPELVVAFPGGRGTQDMVSRATLAKVQVEMIY